MNSNCHPPDCTPNADRSLRRVGRRLQFFYTDQIHGRSAPSKKIGVAGLLAAKRGPHLACHPGASCPAVLPVGCFVAAVVSSRFTWGRKRPGTARESGLFPWPQQFVLSRTAAVPSPWQMVGTNIGVSRRTPSLQRAPSGLYLRSDSTPKWHSAAVPCVAHRRCRTKVGSTICSGGGTHRAHALRMPGIVPVGSARRLS